MCNNFRKKWRKRKSRWDRSRGSQCSGASRHSWVKAPPLGIDERRHLCAAGRRDRPSGTEERAAALRLFPFQDFLLFSPPPPSPTMISVSQRFAICEGLFKQTSKHFCRAFAVSFVGMRHWWARRGQDARQRRRLAEAQRLHPGVHGRLPPGRLYLPVLRLHVSMRKSRETGDMHCWFAAPIIHPSHPFRQLTSLSC